MRDRLGEHIALQSTLSQKLVTILGILFGCTLLGWGAPRVADTAPQALIGLVVALSAVALALVPSEKVVTAGFYAWILTFALGYRSIWLTPQLGLHPSEMLIWALFVTIVARKLVHRESFSLIPLSLAGKLFLALSTLALFVGLERGITVWGAVLSWDHIVAEYKPVLMLWPLFFVVREVVTSRQRFDLVSGLLVLVAVYVSLLGMLEYLAPAPVRPLLAKFLSGTGGEMAPGGFRRAPFSFWGTAFVASFLLLAVPLLLRNFSAAKRGTTKLAHGIGAMLVAAAAYLSGYRQIWITLPVILIVYSAVGNRGLLLALMPVGVLSFQFFPDGFLGRLDLLLSSDQGTVGRLDRIEYALRWVADRPFVGYGWAASGWVHSDLVQIAANAGVPALLAFLAWCGGILYGLLKTMLRPPTGWQREYACAFLAIFVGMMATLATQAIIVLPQLIGPYWLFLALADRLPALAEEPASAASE